MTVQPMILRFSNALHFIESRRSVVEMNNRGPNLLLCGPTRAYTSAFIRAFYYYKTCKVNHAHISSGIQH